MMYLEVKPYAEWLTHLEKRSARALFLPRPLSDSSLAVTRKDCVAQDCRLNEPLSISDS